MTVKMSQVVATASLNISITVIIVMYIILFCAHDALSAHMAQNPNTILHTATSRAKSY